MPTFSYKALDKNGIEVSGTLEADDEKSFLSRLRDMGCYLVEIEEVKPLKSEKEKAEGLKKKSETKNDKKNPDGLLAAVSFFLPLIGFILGIIFVTKPGQVDKNTGKRCLGWALGGFILGSIVIGIWMGMATTGVVPELMVQTEKTKESTAWADIDAITIAVEMYFLDCDYYPSGKGKRAAVGFDALVKNVENKSKWDGPYIELRKDVDGDNIPEDPWGNEYEYEAATFNAQDYAIWCKGAKGDYKAYYKNAGDFNQRW